MTRVGVGKGTEGEGRINGKEGDGRSPETCIQRLPTALLPAACLCSCRSACMLHRLCAVMCFGALIPRPKLAQLKSISLAFYCCSAPVPQPTGHRPPQAACSSSGVQALLVCPYSLGATLLHLCTPMHSMHECRVLVVTLIVFMSVYNIYPSA